MKTVGVLARSEASSIIYFCEPDGLTEKELEELKKKVSEKLISKDFIKDTEGKKISIIAVESDDEMVKDKRIAGLVFKDEFGNCVSIVTEEGEYSELDYFMEEIAKGK